LEFPVNFTRDPLIETVITPREGYKLLVRSTKNTTQEDYLVDALEVVSFGHSNFYRSQERPSAFLVPVADFEVLETREQRVQLKNTSSEQSIKIGGGRDAPPPPRPRENDERDNSTFSESRPAPERGQGGQGEQRGGRNRRRRRRGRDRDRGPDQHQPQQQQETSHHEPREHREPEAPQNAAPEPVEAKAPSFISKLFPPPQTLIKETLNRYKPAEGDAPKADLPDMNDDEE
jgi:hypothetical protein